MTYANAVYTTPFTSERERDYRQWVIVFLVLLCIGAIARGWFPNEAERASFSTTILNTPPIGHWLYTEKDLIATRDEILAIENRIAKLPAGGYTPTQYLADLDRVSALEFSMLPDEYSYVGRGAIRREPRRVRDLSIEGKKIRTWLPILFSGASNEIMRVFNEKSTRAQQREVQKMADARPMQNFRLSPEETDWHYGVLFKWMAAAHIQSMLWVLLLFVVRTEIVGQKKRLLLYEWPKTIFYMFFWPVGIFLYPTNDVRAVAKAVRRWVIWAFRLLMSTSIPQMVLAQTQSGGNAKRNTLNIGVEFVDKYHGLAVGEIFQDDPGARFSASYSRTTDLGTIHVDSWNSVGPKYNSEAYLGFGVSRSGFDVSFTHLFAQGGDVESVSLSKSWAAHYHGNQIPLRADLMRFYGTGSTSPPGGAVLKVGTGFSHKLTPMLKNLGISHSFAIGVDNNPFGLGKGLSSVGFYGISARYKGAYAGWNASDAIAGRSNTTRGFRQSLAAGYNQQFDF